MALDPPRQAKGPARDGFPREPPERGDPGDDRFEKISAQGRDYGRLAYMSKLHAFTEQKKTDGSPVARGADQGTVSLSFRALTALDRQ